MEVKQILISEIVPSPMNPRKTISEEELKELAANIAKQGLLQPITVRPIEYYDEVVEGTDEIVSLPTKYEIVCGERRFRAVSLNADGNDVEVSCIVREMSDSEAFDAMITENLQRKDVDPIEEAFAFGHLKEKGQDIKSIAAKFGKSERYILDRIKLSQLSEKGKKAVQEGRLPLAGAIMLAKLDNDKQDAFLRSETANYTTSGVSNFIANLMRDLSRASWKDEDEGWPSGIPSCKDCLCNTSNYGCLFWEMKGDIPKCTNEKCFANKQEQYVYRKLSELNDTIVKKGGTLDFGKTVIVDDGLMTSSSAKAFRAKVEETYEIVPASSFERKCFYDVDDDRVKEGLESCKMYMCIQIHDYNAPCFKLVPYWVKKSTSKDAKAAADVKEVRVEDLMKKKEAVRNDMQKQSIEKCQDLLRNRSYFKLQGDLSVIEKLVLDVIMLRSCSQDFRGIHSIKIGEEFEFAKSRQSLRTEWIRDFIRHSLVSEQYVMNEAFRDILFTLIHEQYPEDFKQIGADLKKKADKRLKKLDAQIEEIKK